LAHDSSSDPGRVILNGENHISNGLVSGEHVRSLYNRTATRGETRRTAINFVSAHYGVVLRFYTVVWVRCYPYYISAILAFADLERRSNKINPQ
ncbi:MAG: hypothetical protein M3O09_18355, partial [Acidobacteriota bacterium]|nr:hypothetical protein [Acidobacteriota bacterium]